MPANGKVLSGRYSPGTVDEDDGEEGRMLKNDERGPNNVTGLNGPYLLTEDTTCGFWFIKGAMFQKFANKKAYVFLYGLLGCVFSAAYAYFNGTITTLEKRFKIPSRTAGIITVGNDISTLFVTAVLSYYAGRGHRPRWIAVGIYTVVLFCLMNALPHFLYGPGDDSLLLTEEYESYLDGNSSQESLDRLNRRSLCQNDSENALTCDTSENNIAPQVILFIAQLISGVGGSLYYTLGVSYMDDNIKRSKTPALISFSYFIRMLGPALGYALASLCLKFYISPSLSPKINNEDPRWLGAWWLGWLILAAVMFICASLLGLFPKTLPRAAARKEMSKERSKSQLKEEPEMPASWSDMVVTFKRLVCNSTLMFNNFAAVFYFMGYMPYWIFLPKYIETIYKQSASSASLITGTVGLVFSAFGILISGLIITRYQPGARPLAMWNVIVGALSAIGIMSYAFLGCPITETQGGILSTGELNTYLTCNSDCHCDYVKYSPVCGDNKTYISPCHAGCTTVFQYGTHAPKDFADCGCVESGKATEGPCPIDCSTKFYMFLTVCCLLKFLGSTGRASNFLISVRCVEDKDKPVAMGFGLMLMCMFSFIPSPIFFGYIIDTTCLVWGKTCTGTGNCWLYNAESLRYVLNFIAAGFVLIGTLFDFGVWYYVKGLVIFDEETEMKEEVNHKENANHCDLVKHKKNANSK